MKVISLITFFLCLMLAACRAEALKFPVQSTPLTPSSEINSTIQSGMSAQAARYLDDAFGIMEKNSINKYKVDWNELRATCFILAMNSQAAAGTYNAIRCLLKGLQDYHSFFIPAGQNSGASVATATYVPSTQARLIQNHFGYVLIPGYKSSPFGNQFGTDMQLQIKAIDQQNPCSWIVDLRGNTGGDMWPLLIGIGPILGEGLAGSFIDAEGHPEKWGYQDGKGLENSQVQSEVLGQPYHLLHPDAPVAVLFDNTTLSSGEAIVIAFIGRPNTRSFGANSGGLTTANVPFTLSDGAVMALTVAVDADRTGKVYGGAILPDVQVENDTPGSIPHEALDWLANQSACK